jgi:hypothetical protein
MNCAPCPGNIKAILEEKSAKSSSDVEDAALRVEETDGDDGTTSSELLTDNDDNVVGWT